MASAEQAGRLRAERLAAEAEARASAEAAGRERTERLLAEAEARARAEAAAKERALQEERALKAEQLGMLMKALEETSESVIRSQRATLDAVSTPCM